MPREEFKAGRLAQKSRILITTGSRTQMKIVSFGLVIQRFGILTENGNANLKYDTFLRGLTQLCVSLLRVIK